MNDNIIFLVGSIVTVLWGSMVGALLYAVNTPIKRTGENIIIDPSIITGSSTAIGSLKKANS